VIDSAGTGISAFASYAFRNGQRMGDFRNVNTSIIEQERRASFRKTLNPLPYINLPSGNGGIVLDVSEEGLRVRATSPMEESGPFLFWFTAHSNLVAGLAELVWVDEAKKNGGFRFIQLPYNAREHIRSWPNDPNLRPSITEDLALHIYKPEQPSLENGKRNWRDVVAAAVTSWLAELQPVRPWAYFMEHKRHIFKTACASLIVIMSSIVFYTHRRQAGNSVIWLGLRISGKANSLAPASTVPPSGPRVENRPAPSSPMGSIAVQGIAHDVSAAVTTRTDDQPSVPPPSHDEGMNVQPGNPESLGAELVVQVAALTQESEAKDLADTLRRENFQESVRTLPGDSLFRVVLGPYADKMRALSVRTKLKKAGFQAFIRRESSIRQSNGSVQTTR
jgi:SPOR domain